jgi:protease IV
MTTDPSSGSDPRPPAEQHPDPGSAAPAPTVAPVPAARPATEPRPAPRPPYRPPRPSGGRRIVGVLLIAGGALLVLGLVCLLSYKSDDVDEDGPRVGVVQIKGIITSSRKPIEELRKFRKDTTVKAIVVRIESPGGSVGPSQEIYREIERTRQKKVVVASMGAVAASGGYYIAAACEKIVASPGTITGSIGVITQTTQVHELLSLAHVQTHTFKSGALKDLGSPLRPMREEDKAFMQGFIGEIYRQFLRDVAKARKCPEAKIRPIADGRILSGEQAFAAGLVDKLGNFTDALDVAGQLAKAKGEPVPIYPRTRKSFLAELLSDTVDSVALAIRGAVSDSTQIEVRDPSIR